MYTSQTLIAGLLGRHMFGKCSCRGASHQLGFDEGNCSISRFDLGFKEKSHFANSIEFPISYTVHSCHKNSNCYKYFFLERLSEDF